MEGFRTFDHTGDLGLEVWAPTPERLFELAAEALMAQVAEVPAPARSPEFPGEAPELAAELDLEADDAEDLLVHWLNSALLEADIRRAVWTRARVTALSPTRMRARLEGPALDSGRHTLLREVKAVSHHHLALALVAPACHCRLVLDL